MAFFIHTRFGIDKYELNGNQLTFQNNIYTLRGLPDDLDRENLGKTIGIAVYGQSTITDLIWPIWIMEYKDDKEHKRIFVRGLMDLGSEYTIVLEDQDTDQ